MKRAGVVRPPAQDARSLHDSPQVRRLITRFKAILTGEASAVRAKPEVLKELRESGYKIVYGDKPRVIIPKNPGDKVKLSRGKVQRITRESKFATHVTVPKKITDVPAYLNSLRSTPLPPDTQLAFKYFGHRSGVIYDSYELALEDLNERYESYTRMISGRAKEQATLYQNLEFITFKDDPQNRYSWIAGRDKDRRSLVTRKKSKPRRHKTTDAERRSHAKSEKKRRANMTPQEKKEYNEKGAKRAKRSKKK